MILPHWLAHPESAWCRNGRTVMTVPQPSGFDLDHAPIAVDIDEQFYLKPDAGQLLMSPANEDPSPPCDAQPDEMDIAICAERIEQAFQLTLTRFSNKWAGLRSFVADKCPVCGYDPNIENFFWLAGAGVAMAFNRPPPLENWQPAW